MSKKTKSGFQLTGILMGPDFKIGPLLPTTDIGDDEIIKPDGEFFYQ